STPRPNCLIGGAGDRCPRLGTGRAPVAGAYPASPKMSVEVHADWQGQTHLVGRVHPAQRSAAVTFAYADSWLARPDAFAIDPTALPLRPGPHHGIGLFGAIQDCGPDRW